MRNALTLLIALAAVTFVVLAGCKDQGNEAGSGGVTEDSVKLGLFVSTTGAIADFGLATKNGADIAVSEINAAGGINGKQVELVFYDIASKPEEAKSAATKLATQDKVLVGMGAVASSLSLTAAPTFQTNGVPMVSPSSTFPPVTEKGDLIFRICFTDEFAGAALAQFAFEDLGKRKAAIIMNQDDPYSTGLANYFKARFEQLGGKVETTEKFANNTSDFNTQVDNVKSATPDIVFAPVYYNDITLIGQQLRGKGVTVPILGSDGWESPTLLKNAAKDLEGCYFGNHYSQNDPDEMVQGFIKTYADKHGDKPSSLAALGYDVVYFVKNAVDKAGTFDRAKVAGAMRNTKDLKGVTGTYTIDNKRNASKPITMLKITGGKVEMVRQIMPEEVK
ncbi:MAG: ABC transporter substrate-binding protein [Planctomycetes bacterium]|nr:ABC transporter substrate-binding protein [Planctomycetota bacterium]